jgi:hypothetical protein
MTKTLCCTGILEEPCSRRRQAHGGHVQRPSESYISAEAFPKSSGIEHGFRRRRRSVHALPLTKPEQPGDGTLTV